jgi:cytochrome P450
VFERNTQVLTDGTASAEAKEKAGAEVLGLLAELVRARTVRPRDDLTSRLVTGHVATGELSDRDAVLNLALLLGAGHDTSANMLALSVLALLREPARHQRFTANPAVRRTAVEELLRYLTIVQLGLARVATADIEIGDVTVRAGDGVVLSLQAANRDGRQFADPGTLDLARRGAARHLAFGFGPHHCLGHLLARAELDIALSRLFDRLPRIRLAVPEAALTFKDTMDFHGLDRLPVAW